MKKPVTPVTPFTPYKVREHCITNAEIDRSMHHQPLIDALKREKRYPLTPEGLLRVEPTPGKEIVSLHSVSLEAPVEVWSGEPPQLVYCDLLAFRKTPLITPESGLIPRMRSSLYPVEECRLEILFTDNEIPAILALLLDRFPDVTTVWTCEHPLPIRESIRSNYACAWGGHERMLTLWDHGPFDFGTTKLNVFFDARNYLPETEEEAAQPAAEFAGEQGSSNCPVDEDGEELPF